MATKRKKEDGIGVGGGEGLLNREAVTKGNEGWEKGGMEAIERGKAYLHLYFFIFNM